MCDFPVRVKICRLVELEISAISLDREHKGRSDGGVTKRAGLDFLRNGGIFYTNGVLYMCLWMLNNVCADA